MSYINKLLNDWWRVIAICFDWHFMKVAWAWPIYEARFSLSIYICSKLNLIIWNVEIPQTVEWGAIKNWSTFRTFEYNIKRCLFVGPQIRRDFGNVFCYYCNLEVFFYWKWSWNTYIGKYLILIFWIISYQNSKVSKIV